MSKLLTSLLAAVAVLTLAPTTASARPQYCYEICDLESFCGDVCWDGTVTTCGDYGICAGARAEPSEVTASVAQDEAQPSDAASLVCGEAQPSTESSVSVES